MSKTLIVGDLHLKATRVLPCVDELLMQHPDIERVVFLGDYCDDWGASEDLFIRELEELADWVEVRRASGLPGRAATAASPAEATGVTAPLNITLLLGNHDFQYQIRAAGPGTQMQLVDFVRETLFDLNIMAATCVDNFLCTHGGLTQSWSAEHLDNPADAQEAAAQINALYRGSFQDVRRFDSVGTARGGWDIPSPIWADRSELEEDPAEGIDQIVGHTPVATCEPAFPEAPLFGRDNFGRATDLGEAPHASNNAAGPQLWFADTFSTTNFGNPIGDGTMLLVEDGAVSVV